MKNIKVSDSTLRILQEVMNSSEGWHTLIETNDNELTTFRNEIPVEYILEINLEDDGYYIVLGTDWYEGFGQNVEGLENCNFEKCRLCGKYRCEFSIEREGVCDLCETIEGALG